jgi:MFS family permease
MRNFVIVWAGQLVSLLGSAMTWFAFTLWTWQKTGAPTTLSTVSFFAFLPGVLLTPLAGALVDRWNRKLVMMLSDFAAALGTLAALLLYAAGRLEIWHIFVISLLAGFFTAFQHPAYTAAITTMLPKEHYARAEGMMGLAQAASGILAPVFAAALIGKIGISGVMVIDLLTFLAAFGTLLWARIPQPPVSELGRSSRGSLWQEIRFGFGYIQNKNSLRGLVRLFTAANFFLAIGATLLAPMVLSHTANSETALATVQSVGAVGGVMGGALLALWGGPKRRIHGILLGGAGACLLGMFWLGAGSSLLVWSIGSFFFSFFEPLVEGGNLALWQAKVEADVQGRVFAARHWLTQIPYLLGIAAAGPIAEFGLKPAAGPGGAGPAAGIAVSIICAALAGGAVFLAGYAFPFLRKADDLLPDVN